VRIQARPSKFNERYHWQPAMASDPLVRHFHQQPSFSGSDWVLGASREKAASATATFPRGPLRALPQLGQFRTRFIQRRGLDCPGSRSPSNRPAFSEQTRPDLRDHPPKGLAEWRAPLGQCGRGAWGTQRRPHCRRSPLDLVVNPVTIRVAIRSVSPNSHRRAARRLLAELQITLIPE
jgi:hypothetical protein